MEDLSRRKFVKNSISATMFLGLAGRLDASGLYSNETANSVKIGIVGTGGRGTSLMVDLLKIQDVEIVAVCDLFRSKAENALAICKGKRGQNPRIYYKDNNTWKEMLDREKLAVDTCHVCYVDKQPLCLWNGQFSFREGRTYRRVALACDLIHPDRQPVGDLPGRMGLGHS